MGKAGKASVKKLLFILVFAPILLFGGVINTHISFSGQSTAAVRTITQAFNRLGYRLDIDLLSVDNNAGELNAIATGNKPFNLSALSENLKQQDIAIVKSEMNPTGVNIELDTQNVKWDIPLLGVDESTELTRVNAAQWFRIDESQKIRIAPPYTGKWYPEIAVLDSKMDVLYSLRSLEPHDEFLFELPHGAYYLKVSNAQGMKMMKDGMWIESITR